MKTSNRLFCWCLGAMLSAPAVAWSQAPATYSSTVIQHYTAGFVPTATPDSTTYRAETAFRDSIAGVTRVYYPSGKLQQYVPFIHHPQYALHGTLTSWYEDGQMQTKENYVAGKRHGELLTYYPNGVLKRRDHFENGRSGAGNCYSPDGTYQAYFAYEQLPLYPGGAANLIDELERNLRRNLETQEAAAIRNEGYHQTLNSTQRLWEREVLVELVVAKDGRVTNSNVVHSNATVLNAAALRAVANLKRQFIPGRLDGQVVISHFVVPVRYTQHLPRRLEQDNSLQRPETDAMKAQQLPGTAPPNAAGSGKP